MRHLAFITLLVLVTGCAADKEQSGIASVQGGKPFAPEGSGNVVCSIYSLAGRGTTTMPDFDSMDEINHENDMRWPDINVPNTDNTQKFAPFIGGEFDTLITEFGVRCDSRLIIPADGMYTFSLSSEEGSTLSIEGDLVVNNDGLHSYQTASGSKTLKLGTVRIRVRYFVSTSGKGISLAWDATGATAVIPSNSYTQTK